MGEEINTQDNNPVNPGDNGSDNNQASEQQGNANDNAGAPGSPAPGEDTPPVRKTSRDYYLERQARKAEKSAANGQDQNTDIDNEDKKIIGEEVSERLNPVLEILDQKQAESEANDFFADNPDFAPYRNKIMNYWKHPSRNQLPIGAVALEAVGMDNLLKMGADRERAATEKANSVAIPGSTSSQQSGGVDYATMPTADFKKAQEEVRNKRNA